MIAERLQARCITGPDGRPYVSVTSAMRLVRALLGEPEDCYGPKALANLHAMEGTACHAACLDWLAYTFHLLPSYAPPPVKLAHGDERRWHNVVCNAQRGFQEFVTQYAVEPIGIEQEAYSAAYGLIGHLDLHCTLKWKGRRIKVVCDLKFTSAILESHKLQVRCYGKLDGFKDAQLGLIFHGNRETGAWKVEPVDLRVGLDDVAAVANAARLYSWAMGKGRADAM